MSVSVCRELYIYILVMCGAVQLGYSKVVLPMLWDCSQGYLLFVND